MVELPVPVVYSLFHAFLVFLCLSAVVAGGHRCESDVEIMKKTLTQLMKKNDEMTLNMTMVDDGDQQHTVVDHANQAKQIDATDHEMNKDAAVSTMANDNDN